MRGLTRATVLFLVLATVSRARADELTVGTTEYGGWDESIARLESDLGAQGSTVHVTVRRSDRQQLACGDYHLQLDAVGAAAFDLGACAGGATALTLRDRDALYDPGVPPRPRLVGVTVVRLQTSGARGGAAMQGGSTLHCAVEVHPYLVDEQHGGHVPLVPGAYDVRVVDSDATVTRAGDGWTVRAGAGGELTVRYEVVDVARGDVVLRRRLALECSDGTEGEAVPPPAPPAPAVDPMQGSFMLMPLRLGTHVFTQGVALDAGGRSAPFATQELYFDMDFPVLPWMYVGIDYPMVGYSAVSGNAGSSVLDMGLGAVVGFHTTAPDVQVFGEAAVGLLFLLGEVADASGHPVDPVTTLATAELRAGVNWIIGSHVAVTAYLGCDALHIEDVNGGVGMVFWI